MSEVEVPVLVVGAGPAGLTTALALSRYGIKALLVERYAGMAHTPRAHIVNQRTVEIMRHLGVEQRLLEVATPPELMRNTLWVTSLIGDEIARLESWGTGTARSAEYEASSPSPMLNCPQTVFEPVLLEAVQAAGCEVRSETDFVSFVQDEHGVVSTLRDRVTGEETTVRSQYLVGADGARSRVLAQAGLTVEGPGGLADCLNIWFRADLSEYLAYRPGVLTWNVAPGPLPATRLGTLICHKPFVEFVLVIMYDREKDDPDAWDASDLRARVHAFIGNDSADVEILGSAKWQVNAQVAPTYSAGRVFCMGDAVHRHPPTNGLGLNLSVADGYNLAWKLALVLGGKAARALLDTYSAERQPVGSNGVRRAITSRREIAAVSTSLGYEPGQSLDEGERLLAELNAAGEAGERRRASLRAAIEQTNYQFNAHGIELGYRYVSDAVIADEGERPPLSVEDPELFYRPTTTPGARVPHARLGHADSEFSTLDLADGLDFVLLTGLGGEVWKEAAKQVEESTGVRVQVHVVGAKNDIRDLYGEWAARREVDEDGCVLIRPDRHVGWRSFGLSSEAFDELSTAIGRILGTSNPNAGGTVAIKDRESALAG